MRISILGNEETIKNLKADLESDGLMTDIHDAPGSREQAERLGFDLGGTVVAIIGTLGTVVTAVELAKLVMAALKRSKSRALEIKGPTATKTISLEGKTEEEVVQAVREALPFLT
ncbi:hypothetical protein NI456_11225 [Brevundimonas diminuta]|uniref:hypothetical protein n=1 Tax=Brevundimonas diminuta TaxID=293 RepID=UPI002096FB3B|nr:hypothetical protein [Brevundimonas diminuta]MCO8019428.1 hypothetical protein [Brevundimonas diminuta]MCO8022106.1 hypothetical protein [Brevundimonas diminuta]